MTTQELMEQMLPEMNKIVNAWNNNGIIIESQFAFADHLNLKHRCVEIYEILADHGAIGITSLEDKNDVGAFVIGDYIPGEGVMYCLFNPDILILPEVTNAIHSYYERKYS